jgi:outer membrane protein OmpA-like peptidoglycan-associated protein
MPPRYHFLAPSEKRSFTIDGLYGKGTLDIYYDILNIIGFRMNRFPDAVITLTGCNSATGGKETATLSRQRAEGVARYLRDIWGIADTRMKIEARDLPEKPSNPRTADGIPENRRVEIAATRTEILEPIFATDILRVTNPPTVRLKPNVTSSEGVKSWSIRVSQQGKVLKEFTGKGTPPPRLDWNTAEEQASIPRAGDALLVSMQVLDSIGTDRIVHSTLPVELITLQKKRTEKIGDKEVDIFNLILFDFDKSELNDANLRIIDFVKSRLAPTSKIAITGYTDRTGDETYNQKLSADRADATRRGLARPDAVVSGVGEAQLLYPNDHPEGRFYCRTVQIVSEKVVK